MDMTLSRASTHARVFTQCVWAAKRIRNGLVDRLFVSRSREMGSEFADVLRQKDVRRPCFTVAFNTPWTLDLLCASWRRHRPGMELIAIDNSSKPEIRRANSEICDRHCVPYLELPRNPEWNPSRSHALAMNWVWNNVVKWLEPEIVGWIDHDCFPVRSVDLPCIIGNRIAHGFFRESMTTNGAWYLWAGYCFFKFAAVSSPDIDFKPRIDLGLDTGGGNWPHLSALLQSSEIGRALVRDCDLSIEKEPLKCRIFDESFLHVGGVSYRAVTRTAAGKSALRRAAWDAVMQSEPPRRET